MTETGGQMRIKICGITTCEDASAAGLLGANFIGLIRADSPRSVPAERIRELVRTAVEYCARPVLLYRNAPLAQVCDEASGAGADLVQLHGCETLAYMRELSRLFQGVGIIRAVEVDAFTRTEDVVDLARRALGAGIQLEALILDAPKNGPHPGFGRLAELSREWRDAWARDDQQRPQLWCAGGLRPGTLELDVAGGVFEGLDVARGIECEPGIKDVNAMARFISAARRLGGVGG